ncbi:hypothetical protein MPSEU_000266000 [Mayamaea pseudoterrestris]|nr:hypothetical protein MPSEU_000266000 [Mayamaea pseudoterrestris]
MSSSLCFAMRLSSRSSGVIRKRAAASLFLAIDPPSPHRSPSIHRFSKAFSSSSNDSPKSLFSRITTVLPFRNSLEKRKHLVRYYKYLRLETFRPLELERRFQEITKGDESLTIDNLQPYLLQRIKEMEQENSLPHMTMKQDNHVTNLDARRNIYATMEAEQLLQLLFKDSSNAATRISVLDSDDDKEKRSNSAFNAVDSSSTLSISQSDFCNILHNHALQVDYQRTAPIISSMLLVGLSVGILSPAMPFIVQELELSSSQFGLVVSAFGLAKMLANVPSAIAVERHGRKPYMTYSLGLIAVGVAGIGLSSSFEQLYVCRLLTGVGVAALSTGGTMMMTDVSTPLNRATTIAPIMSAFSAGTALGGVLVDVVGLHATFYLTGACFMGVAALNRVIMTETKPTPTVFPWQKHELHHKKGSNESVASSTKKALAQWAPLWKQPGIQSVLIMNGMYWVALAGAQMTLLPLILTDTNGLAMSAMQIGQVYAAMSMVQIFGNPVFAKITDRVGKAPAILAGCSLISASMAGLSFCETYTGLSFALGTWAIGSSMLSTAPVAYVTDKVSNAERAQALALLRTCGDVGFLVGASSIGTLADYTGLSGAMQCSAGVLATSTLWFATRHNLTGRLSALMNK